MSPDFIWLLLIPLLLSVFYSYTQSRIMIVLQLLVGRFPLIWLITSLAIAFLSLSWSIMGYPLPMLYVIVYLFQAFRLLAGRPVGLKNWFMLNLYYANSLSLHLILIGAAALVQNTAMSTLLELPLWRLISISTVLGVGLLQDLCFLFCPNFSNLLSAEAESEEAKPFMAFLWFCAGYLLVDSILCVSTLEPLYPPLFLVGSSMVVMFTLIRFLLHINALIKSNHLKEEHDQLESRLEATEESNLTLRQIAERDALTGVYSRRYAMDHINALVADKTPFSLVFLDLDLLKKINDTQGHDAGDAYLIQFAKALGDRLRERDLLARVGGDEFIVLMPGCPPATADSRIEEIRQLLESPSQGECRFRFSYGVTAPNGHQADGEILIREADRAMYLDKLRRRQERGRL